MDKLQVALLIADKCNIQYLRTNSKTLNRRKNHKMYKTSVVCFYFFLKENTYLGQISV